MLIALPLTVIISGYIKFPKIALNTFAKVIVFYSFGKKRFDSLTQLFSGEEPAKEEPAPKPITKEEVRAELAAKSAAGYGVQVRALLKRYGASQLSAVNPDDYADLLLETQAIGTEVGADD